VDLDTATTFGRAFVRALRDSNETGSLLTAEEISSVGRMDALLEPMRASDEGRAILAERPRIDSRHVDFDALRALPVGTLGRDFTDHLERHELDPDALSVPVVRGRSADANYLLERVRQTHDIWHTLLGLGAAGHEEVLVHAFQWPQLRMPYSAFVVFFGTFKHLIGEARLRVLRQDLGAAFRAGAIAAPLLPVYWERHWGESTDALRERLRVRPASGWSAPSRVA
jgi:ubiquinone biosynthesis protein COQ4